MIRAFVSLPGRGAVAALLLTALLALPAQSQTSASAGTAPDVRMDVNVVNVLCTVRNRKGAYVSSLGKGEFQIQEDGEPQEIRYFARDVDSPFTVALLLDVSGSVSKILETERLAGLRFFYEALRPGDSGLVASFAQTVDISQDVTSSADRLRMALRAVHPFGSNLPPEYDPHGGTLLYEAIQKVCDLKLARIGGRKIVVVISDGFDNGSRINADAAIRSAQMADAVIYAIHYSASDEDSLEGERTLERLSQPTGGRNFSVGFRMPLDSVFRAITEEVRSQYALGYISTNKAQDGAYRKLTVKLTQPGLKVQTRAGYYAPR